jgi:hypothetical protein
LLFFEYKIVIQDGWGVITKASLKARQAIRIKERIIMVTQQQKSRCLIFVSLPSARLSKMMIVNNVFSKVPAREQRQLLCSSRSELENTTTAHAHADLLLFQPN